MNESLTIQEKLKDLRVERGLTLEQLAEQTGLSKSALGSYEADDFKDISHTSALILARFYGVSTDYLLGITDIKNHPNADFAKLHLSDDAIAILESGKINNRLLCEFMTHEGFPDLLADMEIYVDGLANMQIQNLNAAVDAVRAQVIEQYNPDADDKHLRILEAAHIDEGRYFTQTIHRDMDVILNGIKDAHRKDAASAPETPVAEQLKKDLEEYRRMPGSPEERKVALLCKQLNINYHALTPEEFRTLIAIMKKSKYIGIPKTGRRKKGRR